MEIKTITVNGLPLTKTVFEQIPEVDVLMFSSKKLTVLGYVSFSPRKLSYVVGFSPDQGLFITRFVNTDVLKEFMFSYFKKNGFHSNGSDPSTLVRFSNIDYSVDVGPFVPSDSRRTLNTMIEDNYSSSVVIQELSSTLNRVFVLLDSFKTSTDKIEQLFYT